MNINLGGILISKFSNKDQKITLRDDFLKYDIFFLKKNKPFNLNNKAKLIINPSLKKEAFFLDEKIIKPNNFALLCNQISKIESSNNNSIAIVVSNKNKTKKKKKLIKNVKDIKFVKKPWGYEIWFIFKELDFAFKKIFIKKGFKTSLQYHRYKKEINLLFDGAINLHYKKNRKVKNKLITSKDIIHKRLSKFCAISVNSNIVHRIEAITDIILYEASTLQLNDVIRLADDTKRSHGKIHNEHK